MAYGEGTPEKPFSSYMREVVRILRADPRSSVESIKNKKNIPGLSSLRAYSLTEGILADVLQFRVELKRTRDNDNAGTKFIEIRLKSHTIDCCKKFESQISKQDGVVEWDKLAGSKFDYLIRIVNKDIEIIRDQFIQLQNVENASISGLNILSSGVVDKFEADDFWYVEKANQSS